jgi:hypothetical protein
MNAYFLDGPLQDEMKVYPEHTEQIDVPYNPNPLTFVMDRTPQSELTFYRLRYVRYDRRDNMTLFKLDDASKELLGHG